MHVAAEMFCSWLYQLSSWEGTTYQRLWHTRGLHDHAVY